MFTLSQIGTTKQRTRLDLDGFSFIKDRKTNEKIYWRCIKYKSDDCHARLHTDLESKRIVKYPGEHNCKCDALEHELRQFSQQVAYRALNTQETADTILTNSYKGTCSLIETERF